MLDYFKLDKKPAEWRIINEFQVIYRKTENDEYTIQEVNFFKRKKRIRADETEVIFSGENLSKISIDSDFGVLAYIMMLMEFEKEGFTYQSFEPIPFGLLIEYDKKFGFTEKDGKLLLNLNKLDLSKIRLVSVGNIKNDTSKFIVTGELDCLNKIIDYDAEKNSGKYTKDKIYMNERDGYLYYGKMKKQRVSISTSKDKKTKELYIKESNETDVDVFVKLKTVFKRNPKNSTVVLEDENYFTSEIDKNDFDNAVSKEIKSGHSYVFYNDLHLQMNNPLDMEHNSFDYLYKRTKDELNKKDRSEEILECLFCLEKEKTGSILEIIKTRRLVVDAANETAVKILKRIQGLIQTFVKTDDEKIDIIDVIETLGINFDKFIFEKEGLKELSFYCGMNKDKGNFQPYYKENITNIGHYISEFNSVDYQFILDKDLRGEVNKLTVKATPEIKEGMLFSVNRYIYNTLGHFIEAANNYTDGEKNKSYQHFVQFVDYSDFFPAYELFTVEKDNICYDAAKLCIDKLKKTLPNKNIADLAKLLKNNQIENKLPLNVISNDEICFDTRKDADTYHFKTYKDVMEYLSLIGHFDKKEVERMIDKFTDFPELFRILERQLLR